MIAVCSLQLKKQECSLPINGTRPWSCNFLAPSVKLINHNMHATNATFCPLQIYEPHSQICLKYKFYGRSWFFVDFTTLLLKRSHHNTFVVVTETHRLQKVLCGTQGRSLTCISRNFLCSSNDVWDDQTGNLQIVCLFGSGRSSKTLSLCLWIHTCYYSCFVLSRGVHETCSGNLINSSKELRVRKFLVEITP